VVCNRVGDSEQIKKRVREKSERKEREKRGREKSEKAKGKKKEEKARRRKEICVNDTCQKKRNKTDLGSRREAAPTRSLTPCGRRCPPQCGAPWPPTPAPHPSGTSPQAKKKKKNPPTTNLGVKVIIGS
jgi:hypothetical protein